MTFHEIEILQSTNFPISCHDVKVTKHSLISIGTYKPCIKIHNFHELSLKNERNLENEPLKVEPLTDDATKIAILRNDRYVELHAKFGHHSSYRIPSIGRNIQYNAIKADLLTQSDEAIYLFNLEEGRFRKPVLHKNIVNMHLSSVNGILSIACTDKIILYDYRSMSHITELSINNGKALQFSRNGISLAYNELNLIKERDLRMDKESFVIKLKDEINQLRYNGQILCASDIGGVYLIEKEEISTKISVENINSFDFDGNIFFIGCEDGFIKIFHNPEIRNDPDWCRSVDLNSCRINLKQETKDYNSN